MSIKTPKIDKDLLVHTITWYRNNLSLKINKEKDAYEIKHVRVSPNMVVFNQSGLLVESGMGNFQIYYQPGISSSLPKDESGNEIRFAIGDTIKWDQNPNLMEIKNIRPTWGDEGTIHHWEIWCD